ncbi:XRE family transcriptional regulator [Gracilibacillus dipsosauri]|uniref:XRE family transcriptional regulator n=2 Tax=Gracilibacillus dipsosauri TaxID=178340 RepID=A0A317KSX3_9BACI|nr:XRE family transcriptional regulator [Gracilibacillus dipsosauri]
MNMSNIKINLLQLMLDNNIRTVKEVSEKTGISLKSLYGMANEKTTRIDFKTVVKLCEFFDCDIKDLFVYKKQDKAV